MTCTFFGGVFLPVQSGPVVGAESAKDLDETEGGSAVLEAPRPPNSLLSISAGVSPSGLRVPPTFRGGVGGGGEPPQGRKNTTKQHRAAGQCVCVSHVTLPACGFLEGRMRASAYVFVVFVYCV